MIRRPTTSFTIGAAADSPSRGWSRAWRRTRAAAIWREWAWPAETSTATARLDLAVTNFFNESTTLYHNHGGGNFSDRSTAAGLAASTRQVLGFGLVALDANNDGRLDLVQANGHVGDYRPEIPYAMSAQLFLGDGAGKLLDVSNRAGPPWQVLRLGRGLAAGDLDNDGRIDMLLVGENDPLALLHNQNASHDHFLMLALEGTTSNRDAVGAGWPSPLRVGPRSRCGSAAAVISPPVTHVFTSDWDRRGSSIASRSRGPRAPRLLSRPRRGHRVSPARGGPCSQTVERFFGRDQALRDGQQITS